MKRITAALSVVALVGCGTAPKKPSVGEAPKSEETTQESGTGARAAKGAVGGAAVGAGACLSIAPSGLAAGPIGLPASVLVSLLCLPIGIVGGAVIGGTVSAARSPTKPTTTPSTAFMPVGPRTQGRFVLVASGHVGSGEVLQPGALHVAMNTIAVSDQTKKRVSLVLDLDSPTAAGGRSLVAQTLVSCDGGAASIHRSFTYSEPHGAGQLVEAEENDPPKVVDKPGEALSSAVRTVCEAGPWWNTPAQIYGG